MPLIPPLHDAVLSLGANEGDPPAALAAAKAGIAAWPRCRVVAAGEVVHSEPWGPVADQPPFLNQVVKIQTAHPALALMDLIDLLEHRLGRRREREVPMGPRPMDIDLLTFDRLVVSSPRLTLPHPGLFSRRYLLELVAALDPALPIGAAGQTPGELLAALR